MNRLVIDAAVASRSGNRLDTGSASLIERLSTENSAYYGALLAVAEVIGNPDNNEPEKTVVANFKAAFLDVPECWSTEQALEAAFNNANKAVRSDAYNRHAVTMTSLVIVGGHLFIGHAGNNRVWLFRDGRLKQLTSDHSQPRVNQDPILTRACGLASDIEMDFQCKEIHVGDVVLLTNHAVNECLDGSTLISALVDEINASRIAEAIANVAVKNGISSRACIIVARIDQLAAENKGIGIGNDYPAVRTLPESGEIIDGFEIGKRKRKGRLSHYYSAIDMLDDLPVLLKFPDPLYMKDTKLFDCFVQDEWLSRQISHPVLARAVSVPRGRRSGMYSVLERVAGENLAQRLKRKGRLEPAEIRIIAGQLLGFLEHIHQQHIFHRDIRPENIILNKRNKTIHLVGFDCHRIKFWLSRPAKEATQVLSARYLAPESFENSGGNARTDIFAAGVTFYYLLTGKLPYGNVSSMDDLMARKFRSVRKYNADLPKEIADAIDHACSFDPEQRFPGATEFMDAMS